MHKAHHYLILHGRYVCLARNPKCRECGLRTICLYYKKEVEPKLLPSKWLQVKIMCRGCKNELQIGWNLIKPHGLTFFSPVGVTFQIRYIYIFHFFINLFFQKKVIRHPFYLSILILFLGITIISWNSYGLLLYILIIITFTVRIKKEEKELIIKFGEEYTKYKKEIQMLIQK